jgi:prepilin-type N-terminal cleavage/methylation domain-containing protein
VITLSVKERFLREERGFSLPEMITTIFIMGVVFLALHSIFTMSLRVYSFGNNKVEAVESARLGLEKMEREIRQAYAFDRGNDNPVLLLFETWDPAAIRFGNELDGNMVIECPNADQCEKIGYQVYENPAGSGNYALGRDNSSTGTTNTEANLQPVAEYVDYVDEANTGLSFEYLGSECPPAPEGCEAEDQIERVRIELRIRVDKGLNDATQILTTDVALRNRGG